MDVVKLICLKTKKRKGCEGKDETIRILIDKVR